MKKLLLVILLISVFIVTGCDNNKDDDVVIQSASYVNTSDYQVAKSYNGFKAVQIDKIVNEDGSVDVIFKFKKVNNQ